MSADMIRCSKTYNPAAIADGVFVILSDAAIRQGSAFALDGVGLITCAHVVTDGSGAAYRDLYALRSGSDTRRVPVRVVTAHSVVDLAILEAPELPGRSLARSSAAVRQLDQVLLAGYPQHNLGDTLSVRPAVVAGFRQWHGVRRVLVNAGIVAGMSGGPVLDAQSGVIGVAVTGADSDGQVDATENHGFVPIDAIDLLETPSIVPR